MHAVAELPGFTATVRDAGLSDLQARRIVDRIAASPTAGEPIPGTGGPRKVRCGGRGKGKSGGFRVITFCSGPEVPVFLITLFAKGLTQAERNAMKRELAGLVEDYRRGARRHVRSR
jgi:hypothetical protein